MAQTQFLYIMTVFQIRDGIINDILSLTINFWWGQRDLERRTHWLRREELVCSKGKDGMGFRDLYGFSLALLEKKLCRVYQILESLIAKLIQAKYHKNSNVLETEMGYRPTFIWRSLMKAQDFLWSGLR